MLAHLCGINDGAVEDEAPEPIRGLVVRTEFIIRPVTPELHVVDCGARAWKSQVPLVVQILVQKHVTAHPAGTVY